MLYGSKKSVHIFLIQTTVAPLRANKDSVLNNLQKMDSLKGHKLNKRKSTRLPRFDLVHMLVPRTNNDQ